MMLLLELILILKVNYWNKAAQKVFGYSKDEALGMNSVELLRPIYDPGERDVKSEELKNKWHV